MIIPFFSNHTSNRNVKFTLISAAVHLSGRSPPHGIWLKVLSLWRESQERPSSCKELQITSYYRKQSVGDTLRTRIRMAMQIYIRIQHFARSVWFHAVLLKRLHTPLRSNDCMHWFVCECSASHPEQTFDFQSLQISATSASAARAEPLLVFHRHELTSHTPSKCLSHSSSTPFLLLLTTATKLD